MKKRLLSLLLVFTMVVSLFPTAAFAEGEEKIIISKEPVFTYERAVSYGTGIEEIYVPDREMVNYENGGYMSGDERPLIWDFSAYDSTLWGVEQIFYGQIDLGGFLINPYDVKETMIITVDPPSSVYPAPFPEIYVSVGTEAGEVQARLEREHPTARINVDESEYVDAPITWKVEASGYNAAEKGTYTVTGDVAFEHAVHGNHTFTAKIPVNVCDPKEIVSIDEIPPLSVEALTTKEELQAILAEKCGHTTAHFGDGTKETMEISWDVQGSDFTGSKDGTYEITGTLVIPEDSLATNPKNFPEPLPVTVRYLAFTYVPIEGLRDPYPIKYGSDIYALGDYFQENFPTAKAHTPEGREITIHLEWVPGESGMDSHTPGPQIMMAHPKFDGWYEYLGDPFAYKAKILVEEPDHVLSTRPQTMAVESGISVEDLKAQINAQFKTVTADLDIADSVEVPVTWDVDNCGYSGADGAYTVTGRLNLPDDASYVNDGNHTATLYLTVGTAQTITGVIPPAEKPVEIPEKFTMEEIVALLSQKFPEVDAYLQGVSGAQKVPVVWKPQESGVKTGEKGTYTLYGDLNLQGRTWVNPDQIRAEMALRVDIIDYPPITSIDPVSVTVPQYAMLENPENKTTGFGDVTLYDILPEKVTVHLNGGATAQIPVDWDIKDYNSAQVGNQDFTGNLLLLGYECSNPNKLTAPLTVTVEAKEYFLIGAEPEENLTLKVLPGTTIDELNALLKKEGKHEFPLWIMNTEEDVSETYDELITFYPVSLNASQCPNWDMDKPGDYVFTLAWPENLIDGNGEFPAPTVTVQVLPPLEIIGVKEETIDVYQGVAPEDMTNVPPQVTAILEGNIEILVDVEWNWTGCEPGTGYDRDATSNLPIEGKLVNLPSKVVQPKDKTFYGTLKFNTIPVDYVIDGIPEEIEAPVLECEAGFTLSEINQILQDQMHISYQVRSVTKDVELSMIRTFPFVLEEDKNPAYDPMDIYEDMVDITVELPKNITFESASEEVLSEVALFTDPVFVKEVVPASIMTREGTAFGDIENKPETVLAVLESKNPFTGEDRTQVLSVDWGEGEGYSPYIPANHEGLTYTCSVNGTAVNVPNYLVIPVPDPVLEVTLGREFDIESISPSVFPAQGEVGVPLGSSLDEILAVLGNPQVELTLKSTEKTESGEPVYSTVSVSLQLREEDNPVYDPLYLGAFSLTGYLPVEENVKNPKGLGVRVNGRTVTYTIASTKMIRITDKEVGTPMGELGLPEEMGAVRNDKVTELLPVTWDENTYDSQKLGSQVVKGDFLNLPPYLLNPSNRQAKAYVSLKAPANAQVVAIEQVFGEEGEPVEGYEEHVYRLTLEDELTGKKTQRLMSIYAEVE